MVQERSSRTFPSRGEGNERGSGRWPELKFSLQWSGPKFSAISAHRNALIFSKRIPGTYYDQFQQSIGKMPNLYATIGYCEDDLMWNVAVKR